MIPSWVRFAGALFIFGISALFCRATTTVACIGDSITAGVNLSSLAQAYPEKLQQLLGTNYNVINYGVSGTTMLLQGDYPYWGTSDYVASHNPPLPDIVIIMLGTNDSKPQNWRYGSNYYSNYQRMILNYTNLSSHPIVFVCTPPPVFGSNAYSINGGIIATNICPLIRELGTNLDHQVIDMQALFAGHGEWFPDNVHPNEMGTSVMAAIVYTALLGDTLFGAIPNPAIAMSGNAAVALTWPGGGAGWVAQTTPALGGTNAWTVVSNVITNDGTTASVGIPVSGAGGLFRLWNPSIQAP